MAPALGCRIEAASTAAMSSTWMREKSWPGLSMRLAWPARTASSALRPGPYNSRQAEDVDGKAARAPEAEPPHLGLEPALGTLARGPRGEVLIDDPALPVAVHAGGREIADPGEARHGKDVGRMMVEHGIARAIGRRRGEHVADPGECGLRLSERPAAVEEERLDPGPRELRGARFGAHGPGYAPALAHQRLGEHARGVAEAETEEVPVRHAGTRAPVAAVSAHR